jgi:valyl-tRNA synthetase
MPFITEEIWHAIAPKLGITGNSISSKPYPLPADFGAVDASAGANIEWLRAVVSAIRRIRSEMNIPPGKTIPLLWKSSMEVDSRRMAALEGTLKFLTKLESIAALSVEPPASATALVADLQIFIPLAGLIDLDAEKARLAKELKRIEAEIGKCRGKLASDTFVANAPPAVVEQERQRLSDWQAQQSALLAQVQKLG